MFLTTCDPGLSRSAVPAAVAAVTSPMGIAPIGKSARLATSFRIRRILQVYGSWCLRRSWFTTQAIRSVKQSYGGTPSLLTKIGQVFSFAVSCRAAAYDHKTRSDLNEPHSR